MKVYSIVNFMDKYTKSNYLHNIVKYSHNHVTLLAHHSLSVQQGSHIHELRILEFAHILGWLVVVLLGASHQCVRQQRWGE